MKKSQISEKGKIWLKKETRSYRGSVFFIACLTVFSTIFSLMFAYMVRFLFNNATDGNAKRLWLFAAILLGLLLLKILLKTLSGFLSERLRAKMTKELRVRTFSKILRSNYANIQAYHSGELLNRLTSDIQEVSSYSVGLFPTIAGTLVQCLGAIVALLTIDPLFTMVYVVCGILFSGIMAFFRQQIKKRHKDVLQSDGEFRSFMQEGLTSMVTLKAYSAEEKATQKAQDLSEIYYQKRMRRNYLHSIMNGVFSALSNFGLILAVVWCGISVLNGNDDYGSILSVILLLMQLQQPFSSVSSIISAYYARIANGERMSEIDTLPCEELSIHNDDCKNIYKQMQSICFENVDFTYGRENIFQSASTEIKKGEIVCLTGASGTGKSTVFRLLLNVFSPTSGKIYLQGNFKNAQQILSAKERNLFAYVPQGHFLFSGTIYENLTFFLTEEGGHVRDEIINDALKTACAEFVWDLPNSLETVLSERGGGLSEGQLQRLAVARAILSNRPILLLDEATSALDSETERRLLENIKGLQNKTCIIVTHRPAALEIADRILLIENEKIIG